MVSFVCNECGYRFEADDKKRAGKCPYCDCTSVEKEKSAEELVNELEI